MRSDAQYVARHVRRITKTPEARTLVDLAAVILGLAGVALFGIGLLEVWGGIWSVFGFVGCVAVVAVSGYDLAPSSPRGSTAVAAVRRN